MTIVKHRKIFFIGSLFLVVASLMAIFGYGLNLGSDFVGGVAIEIEYAGERPTLANLREAVSEFGLPGLVLQPSGENGLLLKIKTLTETEKEQVMTKLALAGEAPFTEDRFSEVGPTLGKELSRKGLIAITLVVILIILYIAFVFRQVTAHHMSSWKYGLVAIVALAHDVIISTGAMALLAHFTGAETDALFLTALLTILGLSINDTIVVFDRIRENLNRHSSNDFAEVVGRSLKETYIRSINTTLAIVITLVCLLIFGPESTRHFAIILLVGMTIGTYSSIFVAANLLVEWEARQRARLSVR
ncbi:MAG: protein translocase subunit SecF [Candidatus Vogelbacteria bacterium CG10_big_fil_rev_8_21_14_0_10_49_38]|uniref:Protein-export membrane protein SecF n=1 Tax=Candidatus Vogelbacteria bacterium CG10_big_fil_rev_8_21_14_0_10_49_38 TaxID=1975043 RepID=A0A2H0RHP4_9BACT|nr:MAG: protein translocase subunit SecF [Candidatus Vogelbacteria bacterium CG10_big_fil_rev_8_21_14_0_10_49_38]